MSAYDPARWSDFALAQLGASAALLGLVFVGLSINLRDVVSSRSLVNRAAEAVVLLGSVLAASTAVLIPEQDTGALAAELVAVAATTTVVVWRLQRVVSAEPAPSDRDGPPRGTMTYRRILGLGSSVLVAVAGITLAACAGGGLYWWPAAVVLAYVAALASAWVLLIEILR